MTSDRRLAADRTHQTRTVRTLPCSMLRVAPPITAPLVIAVSTHKCDVISITITFASQVSSDLSSGRRPTSKSDEFCDANVIVIEPQRCENTDFAVNNAVIGGTTPSLARSHTALTCDNSRISALPLAIRWPQPTVTCKSLTVVLIALSCQILTNQV